MAALLVVGGLLGGPAPASAQMMTGTIPVEEYASRMIGRVATMDLRLVESPGARDFRIASELLGLAEALTPGDEILLRRRYDAAFRGGDSETAMRLTEHFVRTDPDDEVSLLRLLSGRIGKLQTIDERLSAYRRLIEVPTLPVAIRSRLAMDMALLLREQGDVEGFANRLTQATALDSTNKEAALLAVRFFTQEVNDPAGELELLFNVLKADPLDPNVHFSIARLLANAGAFGAARRFHVNGNTLIAQTRAPVGDQLYLERLFLTWAVDGPRAVLEGLDAELRARRGQAQAQVDAEAHAKAREQGMPAWAVAPKGKVDLGMVSLPQALERLRLIAAIAAGDMGTAESAAAALERMAEAALQSAPAPEADPAAVEQARMRVRLELQVLRLWAGVQREKAKAAVASLPAAEELTGTEAGLRHFIDTMLAIEAGETEAAVRSAEAGGAESPYGAIARALAYEHAGRLQDAYDELSMLAVQPFTARGAWALSRMRGARMSLGEVFPLAARLSSIADGIAPRIDRMIRRPEDHLTLSLRPVNDKPAPLETVRYLLTMKNVSPSPLAMGAERTVSTRFLFVPQIQAGIIRLDRGSVPEVIDVDRRLRLEPGQSVTVQVWPEQGTAGFAIEAAVSRMLRVRWQALQGFTMAENGAYVAGPACLSAEAPMVVRSFLKEAQLTPQELARKLTEDSEPALATTVAAVRAVLTGPQERALAANEQEMAMLAAAAAQRYPTLGPAARMMMLATLPPATSMAAMGEFDRAVRAEEDPRVLGLVLVTRASAGDDPALARALESEDPWLKRLAGMVADRLATNTMCYARMGLGPAPQR